MKEIIHRHFPTFDWRTEPSTDNRRLFVYGNPGFKNLLDEMQSGIVKERINSQVVESNVVKMQEAYTLYDFILTEGGMIIPNGVVVPKKYNNQENSGRLMEVLDVNLLIVDKASIIDRKYGSTIRRDFNIHEQSSVAIIKPHLAERLGYWSLKTGTPFFQYKNLFEDPKPLSPLENLLLVIAFMKLEELNNQDTYPIIGKKSLHRQILIDIATTKGLGNTRANDSET